MREEKDGIRLVVDGPVATITIARPGRRNAVDAAAMVALTDFLLLAEADEEVRVVVLTGAGGYFCAGADVSTAAPTGTAGERRMAVIGDMVRALAGLDIPSIAAVEGGAAGLGLGLMCACDLVIADAGARFVPAFHSVGLSVDAALSWSLPRRLGQAAAHRFVLLDQPVDAARACELGLVDMIGDVGETTAIARRIARGPAAAQAVTKELFGSSPMLGEALAAEARAQSLLLASADHAEARDAFAHKRAPDFRRIRSRLQED